MASRSKGERRPYIHCHVPLPLYKLGVVVVDRHRSPSRVSSNSCAMTMDRVYLHSRQPASSRYQQVARRPCDAGARCPLSSVALGDYESPAFCGVTAPSIYLLVD